MLPDYSINSTLEVFNKIQKAAIVINGFGLNTVEVAYLQAHGKADFSGFDLNAITLSGWQRILAYQRLRNSLPTLTFSLIDLFKWANIPGSTVAAIPGNVSNATGWDKSQVKGLIKSFDIGALESFRNEIALLQLQPATNFMTKLNLTDTNVPFEWVDLRAHFTPTRNIAESIRKNIRSRFNESDYEQVVTPLHNTLRMNQRNALIAYLVIQPDLIKCGVVDADSLFEFFLIDVQMGACMQTSRIKQAISSIQSFVQRCILGLEEKYHIPNDALDQTRWAWMSSQVVWTANRKVFLWPENYIVGSLRDDKSPFYTELEGDLTQNDINPQNTQNAFVSYLHKLDQVASMRMVGMYVDEQTADNSKTIHCFARTESSPYFFFYRTLQWPAHKWTSWTSVEVDIPTYTQPYQLPISGPTPGSIIGTTNETLVGSYVTPVVWNTRVFLFLGHFYQVAAPNNTTNSTSFKTLTQDDHQTANSTAPLQTWQIKL